MNIERLIHLKIKVKSLVDEAKTIRAEANKTSGMTKWNLNHHRKTTVREHTRYNLLAYCLLKGTAYELVEKKCTEAPDFVRVIKIAARFGGEEEEINLWVEAAREYLNRKE